MSRKSLAVITVLLLTLSVKGQVFEAVYGFPNVTTSSGTVAPAPVPSVTGLSCGTFSAYGLAANPSASGRFSFTGWPVGAADGEDNYGTFTAALSPFIYYEFSLMPQPGYTLNLFSLSFSVRRSGTGIRNYCVRSSLDGFATNLSASTGTNSNIQIIPDDVFFWKYDNTSTSSDQRGSEVLLGNSFSSLISPLYIRLYAWNSESINGSFSIDDVKISGEMKDSVLLSEIDENAVTTCSLRSMPGYITNGCNLLELSLYSLEGKLVRHWSNPPEFVSTRELSPGFYVVLFRTSKVQTRQKMLLPQ